MKCNSCQYRAVSVVGTQRQVIVRYKAAWDACYACARRDRRRVEKLEAMIVAGDKLNSMYDSGIREEAIRIANRRPQ